MTSTRGSELASPPPSGTQFDAVAHEEAATAVAAGDGDHAGHLSHFARLGAWAATHFRRVLVGWLLVLVVFGFFAVHVENALAGAGWQASNSQSVAARAIIEKDFAGLGATGLQVVIVDHHGPIATDPAARAALTKATSVLRADPRISTVVPPQAGVSISRDGRTAIITAGAAADSNKMVEAADALRRSWQRCPRPASA